MRTLHMIPGPHNIRIDCIQHLALFPNNMSQIPKDLIKFCNASLNLLDLNLPLLNQLFLEIDFALFREGELLSDERYGGRRGRGRSHVGDEFFGVGLVGLSMAGGCHVLALLFEGDALSLLEFGDGAVQIVVEFVAAVILVFL